MDGRRRAWAGLALILLLALAARGLQARFGLPYLHHWDEPAIAHRALEILETGDPNPEFFNYGSLLIYLEAAVDVAHYLHLVGLPEGEPASLESLDELELGEEDHPWDVWYVSHPSFYLWNRWLTALFGTAAVALVFLLARRLANPGFHAGRRGDPSADLRPGLLAALLLAFLPFHVQHSAFVTTDVPASTTALAAVLLTVRFVQERRPRDLALAAFLVGLGASFKYNLAVALVVPAAALVAAWVGGGGADRRGARPWLSGALLMLPAVGFFLGTPYALLDLRTFLDHVGYEVRHYLVAGHGEFSVVPGLPHLLGDLREIARETDFWVMAPALVGGLLALRRWSGWLVFLLPALALVLTARTSVSFHRNLMVVYPFLAVAFGLGTAWLMDRLGERVGSLRPSWRRPAVLAVWGLVLLLLGGRALATLHSGWRTWTTPETRSRAVTQVNRLAADGEIARLAVARELELHRLDLERLETPFREVPLRELACRPRKGERVLVPTGVSTLLDDQVARVDSLERLLARGGEVLGRIPGGKTSLSHFSVQPGLELRRPWEWPSGEPLPVACAAPPATLLRPVDGPARIPAEAAVIPPAGSEGGREVERPPFAGFGRAVVLGPGGAAESRPFRMPAGRWTATWNDAGPAWGPRLRVEVVDRAGLSLAREEYESHASGLRHGLSFETAGEAEVVVRFRLGQRIAAGEGASEGLGPEVRVRRLWIVPAEDPEAG